MCQMCQLQNSKRHIFKNWTSKYLDFKEIHVLIFLAEANEEHLTAALKKVRMKDEKCEDDDVNNLSACK